MEENTFELLSDESVKIVKEETFKLLLDESVETMETELLDGYIEPKYYKYIVDPSSDIYLCILLQKVEILI
jgi:hypothetical protein